MSNANPVAPRKRRPILRAIGLVVLAFVVVYASFAIYLATRPVVISFDAVQKFRDSLPKPAKADDAAWPAYRDALVASGYVNASGVKNKAVSDSIGAWPGADGWAPVSTWIDANQPAFAAARAASKRPVLGFPLAQEPTGADADFFPDAPDVGVPGKDGSNREHFPMFTMSLPHLSSLRALGMVLQADMLRAVEQGDGERATQDLEAMMALSVHVPEGRLLIGDLVGMAIRGAATRAATAAVEWKPQIFTEVQLKRMQAALRSVPPELERIELADMRKVNDVGPEALRERATIVDKATDTLERAVDDIAARPVIDEKGQAIVPLWLADYRTYIGDRREYADDLRAGINEPFAETKVDGIPISEKISTFAADNLMKSCAAPIDLSV